jgi:hypothetical protein
LESDLVAEGLELGNGPLAGAVAVAPDEEVAAKVAVVAVVASRYQQITKIEWPTAPAAFCLPMRRASRQNWAAR